MSGEPDKTIKLEPKVTDAILEELAIEFNNNTRNFAYLQLLVRALTNVMILDQD